MIGAITWLSVKAFFKKVLAWCKKYWQLLVGISIPLILMVVFRKNVDFSKIINRISEDHQKEIDSIETHHSNEIEKREKAQEIYFETIKKVEEKYEKDSKTLDSKKKKEIKKLIDLYQDSPDELAEKIAQLTGMTKV